MNYAFRTAGEQLALFIEARILNRSSWDRVNDSLLCTGRNDALCDFFHELTVINLTCRIVAAGTSLLKETPNRSGRSTLDPLFESEFHDFIRERLFVRPPLSRELLRNAIRAVDSAIHDVTNKERNSYRRWSEREHPFCYMCGTAIDFTDIHQHHKFSLDHIWPQRFGGDSVIDNWLPACASCNSRKKRDFATWAMPDVQSVVLGFEPSENEYTMVDGTHRFALHQLTAKKLAIERACSLKDAFLFLGPWEKSPRLIDEDDVGDFFNLAIHRSNLELA